MKKIFLVLAISLLATSCGPSESDLLSTAIPITQTAAVQEKEKRAKFYKCVSKYSDETYSLTETGYACPDFECKKKTSEQIQILADELSRNCVPTDSCSQKIKAAYIRLIEAYAAYVHGPNPNDTEYGQMMGQGVLEQQLDDANRYLDSAYQSCSSYSP